MLSGLVFLCGLAVSVCQTNSVYYVKPINYNNGTQYCPYPCFNLSEYATNSTTYLTSNVQLHVLRGTHILFKTIDIVHVTNVSIIGQSNLMVIIKCANNGGHLFIHDSQNIKIQRIKFVECGINKQLKYNYYQGRYNHLTPAVAFVNCTNLQVAFVDFENSFGSSLAAINTRNSTALQYVSFYHTKLLDHNNVTHSGLTIEFTEAYRYALGNTTISLNNCHFYNSDGMISNREAALLFKGGTAMTIISDCERSPQTTIQINIEHCKFVNNTLTIGPLVKMDISSGNTNITFTDIIITKNSIRGYLTLNQIRFFFPLIELLSHQSTFVSNITKESTLWVNFKNVLISSNQFTRNIFECALHSNLFVHLFIQDCIFNFNALLMSFMVLMHLTTLSINNAIFVYNSACIDATAFADIETCCFLTSNADTMLFSGHVEFTNNDVAKSHYFLIIYDHIFLKENTVLIISLNYVYTHMLGKAVINVVNTKIYDKWSLMPCFIQYISSNNNLDKEFKNELISLNYSIVIKNNSRYHSTIHGKNLKDCYWLPNSSFKNVHPGTVAKRFVHFDQGENPTGEYYNDCLCYKGNQITECLSDEIRSVYPGQAIEIGFKLTNIDPNDEKQYYSQVNIFDGENKLCHLQLDGVNFSKVIAEQCLYQRISIYVPKNIYELYECSIVHNYFDHDLGLDKRIKTQHLLYQCLAMSSWIFPVQWKMYLPSKT